MNAHSKRVEDLTIADLQNWPVWEFTNSDDHLGESAVRPIAETPAKNLDGRFVGTRVRFANGSKAWALIGNVDSSNPRLTRHFLTITVFKDQKRFTLARYHDLDCDERGPQALATFLGISVDEIFPIAYDLTGCSAGDPAALVGRINKDPDERLTRRELIDLAVM